MPELGEKRRGDAIGRVPTNYYVWVECPVCSLSRWVNPKGPYQPALNKRRLCTDHARDARRHNFNLEGERFPQVRGFE
jgi:hypothetical protein